MQPRAIDLRSDLPALVDLLGRTRAGGGLTHPGGIQWWLRDLGSPARDEHLDAYVWAGDAGAGGAIGAFALVDGTFVVAERASDGPSPEEQLAWLEGVLPSIGRSALELHVADGDPLLAVLERRGYQRTGTELELLADTSTEPERAPLPEGFRLGSLLDVTDEAYIEGHRAAWSDRKPSSYRRELHDIVKAMPQFRLELVTVVIAPDGTVAACCIGWFDERSTSLEIEPLGTHRDYRRRGLGRAVVREIQHRAWAAGAQHVLVWNEPESNPAAHALYTGAGMPPNRHLILLRKELAGELPDTK